MTLTVPVWTLHSKWAKARHADQAVDKGTVLIKVDTACVALLMHYSHLPT